MKMPDNGMLLDLYRCADQPQRWTQLLDRLCGETDARSAVVQVFRFEPGAVRIVWQASDSRTAARRPLHADRLGGVGNPRIDRDRMLRSANRVVRDDDLFEQSDPARDSLREQLADAGLGTFLGFLRPQHDGRFLGIALHRAMGDTGDFHRRAATQLEALAPHLAQAWDLGRQLHSSQAAAQRMRAHLDALRFGVVECGPEGRVRWMNRTARSLVDAGAGLSMHGGVLRAHTPAQSAYLEEEIAAAARAGSGAPRYAALTGAGRTLHLALKAHPEDADEAPAVMIVVTHAQSLVEVPAGTWCRLLGLTPAEAHLVAALAQGKTLEEHAALRGVSIGTVRNQLKQALAKTCTSRQADLVRLALGSAAAHVLNVP